MALSSRVTPLTILTGSSDAYPITSPTCSFWPRDKGGLQSGQTEYTPTPKARARSISSGSRAMATSRNQTMMCRPAFVPRMSTRSSKLTFRALIRASRGDYFPGAAAGRGAHCPTFNQVGQGFLFHLPIVPARQLLGSRNNADKSVRPHRIANPQFRRKRFRNGTNIDHAVVRVGRPQWWQRFYIVAVFAVIVVFDDLRVRAVCPAHQLHAPVNWHHPAYWVLVRWRHTS